MIKKADRAADCPPCRLMSQGFKDRGSIRRRGEGESTLAGGSWSRGEETPVDLLVIGGGINGVGIARDAAGRGLTVLLVERGDLAGATSSASSKLIHGGLR